MYAHDDWTDILHFRPDHNHGRNGCLHFFVKKKTIEHYYTPVDHIFGQTPVVHHEEKVEKKEREEGEGDDKDKNSKKGKNSSMQIRRNR
ncbi:DUF3951 domain-containing protein [Brevibacillus choshinensis]|uniref:DUF3951 domain-containing protein n=1 Tax=Brevibacillus choshinensis TaxID=54911 RepID=UPI000AC2CDD7